MTDPFVPEGAVTAPVEPAAPAPTPARVPVRAPDGTVGTIDASDLAAAATRGFTPLVGHDLEVEQARPEMESLSGRAASFAAGHLRGASIGLSDPLLVGAARAIHGDERADSFRQNLALSEEINPGLNTAGELTGIFNPAAPAGLVGKVGGLAAKGVGYALPAAEGLAGRLGVAGVKAAASGAAEGLFYGAGQVASEDALGTDHEHLAEKLWAGAKKGALFGGLAGGVLGAGSQAGEEAIAALRGSATDRAINGKVDSIIGDVRAQSRPSTYDALGEGGELPIPKPVGEQLERSNMGLPRSGHATDAVDTMSEQLIARQTGEDVKAAIKHVYETEATLGKVDDALDSSTRKLRDAADAAMHVDDAVLPQIAFGEGKAEQMSRLVDPAKWEAGSAAALEMRNAVEAKVKMLEALPDSGGSSLNIRRLRDSVDNFDAKWKASREFSNEDFARGAFMYADKMKREVGKAAGMGLKPFQRNDVQKEAFELYHTLIPGLENEAAWGPAALAQREVNAATAQKLETSEALRNSFLTNFESKGGNAVTRFDPSDIKSYLTGIGGAQNDLKKEALDRWTAGLRGQMDAVEKHYALSAAEKTKFANARSALDTFESEMVSAHKQATVVKNARAMKEAEAGRAIGGLVGLATDVFTRPIAVAERLGQLRRAANKTDVAINEGIEGFFTGKSGAVREPLPKAEAERIMGETKQLANNPPALIERVSKAFTGISEAAPKVATFLSTKALQSMVWLADRAPRNTMSVSSLTPQLAKPVYSDAQLASFGRAYQAMNDPTSVLEDMKNGAITREGVDYLKSNQPRLYAQIRNGMLEKLAVAKEPLPYEKRMQLGILFGIDADPTLNAAFIAAMQQTKATPAPGTAAGNAGAPSANSSGRHGKPLDSKQYMTESERIAAQ